MWGFTLVGPFTFDRVHAHILSSLHMYYLLFLPQQCNGDVCVCPQIFPSLELRPLVEAAYRRHFFQKEHWTYYTEEPDLGPCVLSLKPEADGTVYRCVVTYIAMYVYHNSTCCTCCNSLCKDRPILVYLCQMQLQQKRFTCTCTLRL